MKMNLLATTPEETLAIESARQKHVEADFAVAQIISAGTLKPFGGLQIQEDKPEKPVDRFLCSS
ncbi:MAG: hypothetical protein ACLQO7_01230 [Candidatus Bathyarchaeia archaeon]